MVFIVIVIVLLLNNLISVHHHFRIVWSVMMQTSSTLSVFAAGAGFGALAMFALLRSRGTSGRIAQALKSRNWQIGTNQPKPKELLGNGEAEDIYRAFDPLELAKVPGATYGLMISSIVPRPIALVSSQDSKGNLNCAPFSYFSMVSHDPPLICIGPCMGRKDKKDTWKNIEETGEFVVNIMSSWYVESANHACGTFDADVDEMAVSGLTTLPSLVVKPPRVAEAAVQLECQLVESKHSMGLTSGELSSTLIIARVVKIHVYDGVLQPGWKDTGKPLVDPKKLDPISRLGGNTYASLGELFDIPRPLGDRLFR